MAKDFLKSKVTIPILLGIIAIFVAVTFFITYSFFQNQLTTCSNKVDSITQAAKDCARDLKTVDTNLQKCESTLRDAQSSTTDLSKQLEECRSQLVNETQKASAATQPSNNIDLLKFCFWLNVNVFGVFIKSFALTLSLPSLVTLKLLEIKFNFKIPRKYIFAVLLLVIVIGVVLAYYLPEFEIRL
jgi:hypothetical protein